MKITQHPTWLKVRGQASLQGASIAVTQMEPRLRSGLPDRDKKEFS